MQNQSDSAPRRKMAKVKRLSFVQFLSLPSRARRANQGRSPSRLKSSRVLQWRLVAEKMKRANAQISRKFTLGIVTVFALLMFALVDGSYGNGTPTHETIQWLGVAAILVSMHGRTWTYLYICDRKNNEIVTDGPYSIVRNPLYFFSIVGAAGAGSQIGSVTLGIVVGLLVGIVFYFEIFYEERRLAARHGAKYFAYKSLVPRLLPDPRLWRESRTLTVKPAKVLVSFVESSLFLLTVPLAEIFEYLRSCGILPVLLRLP